MLFEQARQDLARPRDGDRRLAESLQKIATRNEELTPLSVRIDALTRHRLEQLIGHLPKRKRAQALRALLEHAITDAELQGFVGMPPD